MTFAVRTLMDAAGGSGGVPAWTPVTHTYPNPGTFTETIPGAVATGGPAQLEIEAGGAGAGGGYSSLLPTIGGGGGSGSLCRTAIIPLTSADWGKTFTVTIRAGGIGGDSSFQSGANGGTCTVVNGSFARVSVNMQAGGGFGGSDAHSLGGPGGTASGGNQANLSGNPGQNGAIFPAVSHGGAGVTGDLITSGAGGNASSGSGVPGDSGLSGSAAFAYT